MMQFITITGRVGGAPETRQAGSNTVTNFSCAVDQGWGDRKTTNWFRVAIWGERGTKLAQYITKGEKVTVTGELEIGEYNGKPQYEVRAADVDCFMSSKRQTDDYPDPAVHALAAKHGQDADFVGADLNDDVPF